MSCHSRILIDSLWRAFSDFKISKSDCDTSPPAFSILLIVSSVFWRESSASVNSEITSLIDIDSSSSDSSFDSLSSDLESLPWELDSSDLLSVLSDISDSELLVSLLSSVEVSSPVLVSFSEVDSLVDSFSDLSILLDSSSLFSSFMKNIII